MRSRLRYLLDFLHLTPSAFADELQLPARYVRALLKGAQKLTAKVLARIRTTWRQVSLDWLLLGEGPVFVALAEPGNHISVNNGTVHQLFYLINAGDMAEARQLVTQLPSDLNL